MVEIVAEISGNHGGDFTKFEELISIAAWVGCDYAKFQYYKVEDMPDRHVGNNEEMYRKLAVPSKWLPGLFAHARRRNIGLFASVFSVEGAREILEFDVPHLKIAAPHSTLLPPGVYDAIIAEVPPDVEIIWSGRGDSQFPGKTLYCPLGHPPVITHEDFAHFRRGGYWGFSDHTPRARTPRAFIRAGAEMVEKHLKLEGDNDCIDAAFSAEPDTMQMLCNWAHNR